MSAFKRIGIACALVACAGCESPAPEPTTRRIDANTVVTTEPGALTVIPIAKALFPETLEVNGKVSIPDKDILNLTARVQGDSKAFNRASATTSRAAR